MQKDIQPKYNPLNVICSCGNNFKTHSTLDKGGELRVEICSKCHPFFTGKQRIIDSAGRVDKFKQKYATFNNK